MKKLILLTLLFINGFAYENKLNNVEIDKEKSIILENTIDIEIGSDKDIVLEKTSSFFKLDGKKITLDLEFIKNDKECIIRKSKYGEEIDKKEINDLSLPCKVIVMQIEKSTENEYIILAESMDETSYKNNKKSIENFKFIKDKQNCIIEYKQIIKSKIPLNEIETPIEYVLKISNDCNSIMKKIKEN